MPATFCKLPAYTNCVRSTFRFRARRPFGTKRALSASNPGLRVNPPLESEQAVKSYNTILQEALGRGLASRTKQPKFKRRSLTAPISGEELVKPLDAGDVVLLNLLPAVIIRAPESFSDQYIVSDMAGRAKPISLSAVDARLASLVDPATLTEANTPLFSIDGTDASVLTGDPAGPVTTSKVVSIPVHKLISMPLRTLYIDAHNQAQKIIQTVFAMIDSHQKPEAAITMSFVDFVLKVFPNEKARYTAVNLYAVRLCLTHYSLLHKYLLDFSYTGKYAITILPSSVVGRNLSVINSKPAPALSEDSMQFVQDWARGSLPTDEAESRAIELLRKQYSFYDTLTPAEAAGLLALPHGGVASRRQYEFFMKPRGPKPLELRTGPDGSVALREAFPETVHAIDSASAIEIDDGISLKRTNSRTVRAGIHIANPSSFTNQSDLVQQILPVPTSIYALEGDSTTMMPRDNTKDWDLIGDKPRPALSLFVDINLDSMEFSNVHFKLLTLTNIRQITTEKVDQSQKEYADFYDVARSLRAIRSRNGAFNVSGSEDDGFASFIVAEFMILANHLAAKYCREHDIPIYYRGQRLLLQTEQLKEQYAASWNESNGILGFKWRPFIQRSLISTKPSPHAGIGYDMTTRFTSPLRRLEDYINHCQIEAHLQGAPFPFDADSLSSNQSWLQVSQDLIKEFQRSLEHHDAIMKMDVDSEYEAIVSDAPSGVLPGDQPHRNPRMYLPALGVEADYVGSRPLVVDKTHRVRVHHRNLAGFLYVVLTSED